MQMEGPFGMQKASPSPAPASKALASEQGERALVPGAMAILAAAERLIGSHGLDGVSTRQITIAAGMGNNSAVAYHFGDREGLLRAISQWRLPAFQAAAQRLYDQAERAGRLDDPATLVRLVLQPSMAVVDAEGRHVHAAFLREMLRSAEGRAIRASLLALHSQTLRVIDHLVEICPDVPGDLMRYRLLTGSLVFFDALVERDFASPSPEFPRMDDEGFMAEMVGMVTAMCVRPPAPPLPPL
jgi:AcrR family transcriptional regulator